MLLLSSYIAVPVIILGPRPPAIEAAASLSPIEAAGCSSSSFPPPPPQI